MDFLGTRRTSTPRGYLRVRVLSRILRDVRYLFTSVVLSGSRPQATTITIATLNPDEENATVQAVLLGAKSAIKQIHFFSPSPAASQRAVLAAARTLGLLSPPAIQYKNLSYLNLLHGYRVASETYTTHVLLPGVDLSRSRTHVHLTHGSGPKPDKTFRAPTNVLASITPWWVPSQLREYRLPKDTKIVEYMPRLEIMRRAIGDCTVTERLGLDPTRKLAVWAPTYRAVRRHGGEVRISGTPFSLPGIQGYPNSSCSLTLSALVAEAQSNGWIIVAKVHPHEASLLEGVEVKVFTNAELQELGVTPYELFGAADLLITDYSSIYTERAALGLSYALWCPDFEEFANSYRGFREPMFTELETSKFLRSHSDASKIFC